jgi:hypothetical protein
VQGGGPEDGRTASDLKAEARGPEGNCQARDLTLWQMEKTKSTKKGSGSYLYWVASWREGGKVRNVYLGSCRKMDHETACKGRKLKSEALAIKPYS